MLGRIAATMTLKELQIFTLLAELGSVTNVANSLGIAQSAVSRQIADIFLPVLAAHPEQWYQFLPLTPS